MRHCTNQVEKNRTFEFGKRVLCVGVERVVITPSNPKHKPQRHTLPVMSTTPNKAYVRKTFDQLSPSVQKERLKKQAK